MTPFMNVAGSAETDGMLCWQDIVYTEVCDPQTYPARALRRSAARRSIRTSSARRSR